MADTALLERFFKKVRFAIEGPEDRFSAAWATWGHDDTVYIAQRVIGGFIKVSLHPVGGYRLAFTEEFHPRVKDRAALFATRNLAVWPQPQLAGDKPALIASLCFPTDFLRSGPPPSRATKKYMILQAPRPGRAAYVGFFLSCAPMKTLEPLFLTFGTPIIKWDLNDGTSISMVVWENVFDPRVLPDAGATGKLIPLTASGEIGSEDFGRHLAGVFWNEPGLGMPLQITEVGKLSLQR